MAAEPSDRDPEAERETQRKATRDAVYRRNMEDIAANKGAIPPSLSFVDKDGVPRQVATQFLSPEQQQSFVDQYGLGKKPSGEITFEGTTAGATPSTSNGYGIDGDEFDFHGFKTTDEVPRPTGAPPASGFFPSGKFGGAATQPATPPAAEGTPARPAPPAAEGIPSLLARPPDAAPPAEQARHTVGPDSPFGPSLAEYDALNSRTAEQQKAIDDKRLAAVQAQKDATAALADAEAEKQRAAFKLYDEGMQEQNRLDAKHAENTAYRQQQQDSYRAVVQRMEKQQASRPFETDRRGAGGKIGSAIAILLGGLGMGLQGSNRNLALETVKDNIDRDIEQQKEEHARGENTLNRATNNYHDLISQGLSEKQAESALRAAAWDKVKTQVAIATTKFGDKEAMARGQLAIAGIDQEASKAMQDGLNHTDARSLQTINAKNQVREFDVNKRLQEEQMGLAVLAKSQGAGKLAGDQAEKMDAGINGIKTILNLAEKFRTATSGPGSNILGQMYGAGDTRQYQNAVHDSAGALAATFDPGARNNPTIIQRSEESMPSATMGTQDAGMMRFRNQFAQAREYILTRLQNEAAAGHDVSMYARQLTEMDKKAAELGIGAIDFKEKEGGR